MKRILFVITKSSFGGAQRYVYELATNLPKDEFDVHIAVGGNGPLIAKLTEAGIPVHRLTEAQRDIHLFKEVKVLHRLITIIRKVRPNVVHLNSPKMGGIGSVAARICGIKNIIYTNHGWPFKEDRPTWQRILITGFSWLTVYFCTKTIVLSKIEQDMIPAWLYLSHKLVLIPNGVRSFDPLNREDARVFLLGQHTAEKIQQEHVRIVGTISELHKNKGLIYAIEGFANAQLQNTILIIIGEGEERARLEAAIKKHDIADKVFLVGHVDDARRYLPAFDYFMMSSIKEGLPYALLEAGSLGLPVIATAIGGIPEIITDKRDGLLIPPHSPTDIQVALQFAVTHPQDMQKYGASLKDKIQDVYSFEQMLIKTKALY